MTDPQAGLNCDQPRPAPRPRDCPACGQETNLKPPTLGEFAQQFGGAYIATAGALWQSPRVGLPRRKRFTEPLVFALHLHAFWFLMLGLLLTQVGPLGVAAAVAAAVAVPGDALLAGAILTLGVVTLRG